MVQIRFMIFESYQPRYEDRLNVPMDRFSDQEYLIDEKRCYDGLVKGLKALGVSGDPKTCSFRSLNKCFKRPDSCDRPNRYHIPLVRSVYWSSLGNQTLGLLIQWYLDQHSVY